MVLPKAGQTEYYRADASNRKYVIPLSGSAKIPRLRQYSNRCALCKMCSAKSNFGNFKLEKNVNFGRNFLSRRFKNKKNVWTTKARKNPHRKFRGTCTKFLEFKVKKYAVKMAKFSKIPEKFDKQNFGKKMLLAAKKIKILQKF